MVLKIYQPVTNTDTLKCILMLFRCFVPAVPITLFIGKTLISEYQVPVEIIVYCTTQLSGNTTGMYQAFDVYLITRKQFYIG